MDMPPETMIVAGFTDLNSLRFWEGMRTSTERSVVVRLASPLFQMPIS
jgi:hypothetical protein